MVGTCTTGWCSYCWLVLILVAAVPDCGFLCPDPPSSSIIVTEACTCSREQRRCFLPQAEYIWYHSACEGAGTLQEASALLPLAAAPFFALMLGDGLGTRDLGLPDLLSQSKTRRAISEGAAGQRLGTPGVNAQCGWSSDPWWPIVA